MEWLDKQVSIFQNSTDTTGRPRSIRGILFTDGPDHIEKIMKVRSLEPADPDYSAKSQAIKRRIPMWSPSALLTNRIKDKWSVIEYTGLMQLDFDSQDIKDFDIDELMDAVFSFPFTALCAKSVSGRGFYALLAIAEPQRLREYATHTFKVFEQTYKIKLDASKGRNYNDLRCLSYDSNFTRRLRKDPEPLKIKRFYTQPMRPAPVKVFMQTYNESFVDRQLQLIRNATKGCRWESVQKCAYTLGGTEYGDDILSLIHQAIEHNAEFHNEWRKYKKCADDCFYDGRKNPLNNGHQQLQPRKLYSGLIR